MNHLDNIREAKGEVKNYNDLLGKVSYLLAGLLYSLLKKDDWGANKWMDDSLLLKVNLEESKLFIYGIMIWGKEETTEQWTDPFCFLGIFDKSMKSFEEYSFLFSDTDTPEISYSEFRLNRHYWSQIDRKWKYRFRNGSLGSKL